MANTYEINSKYATYSKKGSDNGKNTKESVLEDRVKQQKSEERNHNGES